MVNKYTVTTGFRIESSEMTHVGGKHRKVTVADQSFEVLLDSLQKVGVDIDRENSQKNIAYTIRGTQQSQVVPLSALYEKEIVRGYELQSTQMKISVKDYDHSRSLAGPGMIGGMFNYITGIEVKLEYTVNTLAGVNEKCQKVEEVFRGLYDPITRAIKERLVAMTPKERQKFERRGRMLGEALMGSTTNEEEGVDSGQKVANVTLLEGSPADEQVYKVDFEKRE